MFLSAVWTLILTAPIHCRGSTGETVISSVTYFTLYSSPEENHETLNVLQYVRPGQGFLPKFPIFSRIEVNGSDEHPLYAYLKTLILNLYWSPIKANDIRWNFEKFLITADGVPYRRYDPHCPFEEVERDIATLLQGRHLS
uniref:Glutathione peroxidase 9 n=1 Tax=Sinocyclocheilus grahami TaxID=75366 RepID=A0A672LH49_SINGR